MATQVPYSGTPSVDPVAQNTPLQRIDTPIAAFGGNVGAAITSMGETTEKVGNELFARAIAMETVNQQAEANTAVADFTTKLGEHYAEYRSLSGAAAVAGYKPFIEKVNGLRAELRASLNSPIAQRAYDNESRMMQARTVFSAAAHAGTENKSNLVNTDMARIQSRNRLAAAQPENSELFDNTLQQNATDVDHLAQLNGWSEEQKKEKLDELNSKSGLERVQTLADTKPFQAKKLMDDLVKRGVISGSDIRAAANIVQAKVTHVGANNIRRDIQEGINPSLGEKPIDRARALDVIAHNEQSPAGYGTIGPTTKRGDNALGKYGIMRSNLAEWLAEAGMPSMSEADFLKNGKAQDDLAWFKLNQYQTDPKGPGTFNGAMNRWFTGKYNPDPNVTDATPTSPGTTPGQYRQKALKRLFAITPAGESVAAGINTAKQIDPENVDLPDSVERNVVIAHNRQKTEEKDQEFHRKTTLDDILNAPREDSGKLVTSVEELTATPEGKAAWESLSPPDKTKYLKVIEANAGNGYVRTTENQTQYRKYKGAMLDPNMSQDQRDAILGVNMAQLQMPAQQRDELAKMQQKLFKDALKAPNLTHALQILRTQMTSAGVDKKNKDDYDVFTGSLNDSIQDRMEVLGRPLNDKEIKEIGSTLLRGAEDQRSYLNPGRLFSSPPKTFMADVPNNMRERIVQSFKQDKGYDPSENDIHVAYNRIVMLRQYQELYGKPAAIKVPDRAQ